MRAALAADWLDALASGLEVRGGPLQALEALREAGASSLAISAGVRAGLQRRLSLANALLEVGVIAPSEALALARAGAGRGSDGAPIPDGPPHPAVVALLRALARRRRAVAARRRAVLVGAAGPLLLLWVSAITEMLPGMLLGTSSSGSVFTWPLVCTGLLIAGLRLLGRPGRDPAPFERRLLSLPGLSTRLTRPHAEGVILDVLGAMTVARLDVERTLGVLDALCAPYAGGPTQGWLRRAAQRAAGSLTTAPGALVEAGPDDEALSLVLIAGESAEAGAGVLADRGAARLAQVTTRLRLGVRWALYLVALYLILRGLVGGLSSPLGGGGLGLPSIDPSQMKELERLLRF